MPDAGLPFDEAIAFLRDKVRLPTQRWTDLWQEMHSVGFMVAGATKDALLADFQGELTRAIEAGTTLRDWMPHFEAIVARHGWTGWTGEATKKGRAWRARVIWDTNLRTSHAAGQWQQIQQVKDDLPYLRYSAVLDGRTRPEHRAWHNTILPVDHPWWHTHFPPNGWYCRCQAIPVSPGELKRRGWTVSEQAPALDERPKIVSGVEMMVPQGIDPGFAHNPGQSWLRALDPARFERPELGNAAARALVRSAAFRGFIAGDNPGDSWPIGWVDDVLANAVGSKVRRVMLSSETMAKQRRNHPDLTLADYQTLPDVAEAAKVVKQGDRFLLFLHMGSRRYVAVVKATEARDELYLVSFYRAEEADFRRLSSKGDIVRSGR